MSSDPASGVDTGRLTTGLDPEAHRIIYGSPDTAAIVAELHLITEVDRAHLVMLAERDVVPVEFVTALLGEIQRLRDDDFAVVCERPAPRGLYLAYEGLLVDVLGEQAGGVLHSGRSRNDLNATTVRLRTRAAYASLLCAVDELVGVLPERAAAYRQVVMPACTHGQPAVPITYGNYLVGLACSMLRGYEDLLQAGAELEASPLGAGAVGGTSVPIDPARTAELLGFAAAAPNSVDAVASREFVLRLLAAVSVLGVSVVRAGHDLTVWTSEEFGLVRMPDNLVGSSSMMPQKRNPFVLEHIQGRVTTSFGGFSAAVTAMITSGYTNAIAVGTEAVRHLWPGLRSGTEAVTLLRLVLVGAEPNEQRMRDRAVAGFTAATHLAERLVTDGLPFRSAHHQVGQAVRTALEFGAPLIAPEGVDLDPGAVARACGYGGGPGGESIPRTLTQLHEVYMACRSVFDERRQRWAAAARLLDDVVRRYTF
jgi:argininosuccinate lyase